ncbi:hypothetical protein SynSYN20_01439 [Synechococcus sp. SYN20]|nr:hypothetical protein SynSYN20_01439 [Synechococcus sp. SYN20]
MRFLKIPTLAFLMVGLSGFDFDKDTGLFTSKAEAFEECEDWKDSGNVVVYATNINIAEEASRFGLENLAPTSNSSGSTIDQLKYADRLYKWNQLVENFLVKQHPTKAMKIYSRMCEYEPKEKLFVGYENKKIQDGVWKDEDGMRGRMVKVKYFRY